MDRYARLERLLSELDEAVAAGRRAADAIEIADDRRRRIEAVEHVAAYVGLLRETMRDPGALGRFWLKLEWPDGRWDVTEAQLPVAPRIGDVVTLRDGSRWRVRETQLVRPRPSRKPPREFFVCAVAA